MYFHELAAILDREGFHVSSAAFVHHAIRAGHVPETGRDGLNNRLYGPEHLVAIKAYLANPQRRRGKRLIALAQGGQR